MTKMTRSSFRAGPTMIIAAVVIVIAIGVLWLVSMWLTNRHNARVATDSGGVVHLGEATSLAARFDADGGTPIYFPDVSGNEGRSVYLVHRDERSDEGWVAFNGRVPGEATSCQWEWRPDDDRFAASCDPDRHADASGSGLQQYPVKIVDGKLQVDLRSTLTPTTVP